MNSTPAASKAVRIAEHIEEWRRLAWFRRKLRQNLGGI